MVTIRLPVAASADLSRLIEELRAEPPSGPIAVGDERVVAFLVDLGRRLRRPPLVRRYPELLPVAFFLRPAALTARLRSIEPAPGTLRFPRGLVFHVPPDNVDTLFLYAWSLSALAGNHNVVRLPDRPSVLRDLLVEVLNDTLDGADPVISATQRMISYDRDSTVTAALSEACDLRLLWGGDGAVTELRRFPLRPAVRDLTFPDRSSLAVLSAAGWRAATPAARRGVAEGLYADVYPFDQAGCGSPSTIFWVGGPDEVAAARAELIALLRSVLRARPPVVPTEMALQKRVAAYGLAVEGIATQVTFEANAAVHIDLRPGTAPLRRWLGVGAFAHARLNRLADLLPLIRRRDQTVTHFGFGPGELLDFARRCGPHGADRIVPIGRALEFEAVWDGYDLLREFTRLMTVDPGVSGA